MNNEPVAWMSKEDFEDYLSEDKRVTSATVFNFKLDIPLYTHPVIKLNEVNRAIGFDNGYKAGYNKGHEDGRKLVTVKELTDGEIKELAHQHRWNGDVDFARAILRKAQEADKIESLGTVNIGGVHFRNGKEVK